MALYLYYAADGIYQGLHGMETLGIVDETNSDKVIEIAKEASLDIIQSYGTIMEDLQQAAFDNIDLVSYEMDGEVVPDSEYEKALDEAIEEDIYCKVWKINDSIAQSISYEELEDKAAEDLELFIEELCEKEII